MSRSSHPHGLLLLALLGALVSSCAVVMDLDFGDYRAAPFGPPQDDGGTGGSAGSAGGAGGMGGTDIPDSSTCDPKIVINEVQTSGPGGADDEFVELFNPGQCAVNLTALTLAYRSSLATQDAAKAWAPDPGVVLEMGARYSIGGATFTGAHDSLLPSGFALGATGGGLALRFNGMVLDQVGWGDATNDFVDQLPAAAPASGASIARHPDGADTNDNAVDFLEATPTPGAPNP